MAGGVDMNNPSRTSCLMNLLRNERYSTIYFSNHSLNDFITAWVLFSWAPFCRTCCSQASFKTLPQSMEPYLELVCPFCGQTDCARLSICSSKSFYIKLGGSSPNLAGVSPSFFPSSLPNAIWWKSDFANRAALSLAFSLSFPSASRFSRKPMFHIFSTCGFQ